MWYGLGRENVDVLRVKGGREGQLLFSSSKLLGGHKRSAKVVCLLASYGPCLLKVQFSTGWGNVMEPN